MDEEELKKQQEAENSKKTAHVAGKAAATYFGGAVGAKAYEKASKTRAGQRLEEKAGKKIQRNPRLNRMSNKLNDSGTVDALDKGIDATNGNTTASLTSKDSSNKSKFSVSNVIKKKIAFKATLIILPIAILMFIIMYIIAAISGDKDNKKIAMGSYYSMRCPEVTVIFTDKQNGYEETGVNTYPLEEYVAGVVAGEVAFLGSLELDKAFAIAARSYLLTHDDDCTIESSDRKQVFRELTDSPTDQLAIQAASETAGQVLLSNNQLVSSQYDAFACIAKDNNYYTISQANQKIPIEWVDARISKPSWLICNGRENLQQHHGNGMSQYGGLYLATEKGYTYDEILEFYLGDRDITISRGGFLTSIAGLEVKDTTNSEIIDDSLQNYLLDKGSSVEEMNEFIYESVSEAGKGTREGVVTAAVSIINYLYDNFNVRLPYYWNGKYEPYGVNMNFGGSAPTSCSSTTCYSRYGFDCSGFVSWAIKNGGYHFSSTSTVGFHNQFSNNSCNVKSESCIGQPGDLINTYNHHVQMIVAVDQESGQYMIAESTGGNYGLIMRKQGIHDTYSNDTKILFMDEFYNNLQNVDENY